MSLDPVDRNFRAIARPKIPPAPKVSPGEGLSGAAARTANDLFALESREIGLGRAVLTAFDRSQGAHVANSTAWEKKQVTAAGLYAGQLASALLADASLRPKLQAALDDPEHDLSVSGEDAGAFEESLIRGGLPSQLGATLSKLGVTKADQKVIHAHLLALDPSDYTGDPIAAIADPQLLASLRQMAASLKAFSRKAARDPLHTGQ